MDHGNHHGDCHDEDDTKTHDRGEEHRERFGLLPLQNEPCGMRENECPAEESGEAEEQQEYAGTCRRILLREERQAEEYVEEENVERNTSRLQEAAEEGSEHGNYHTSPTSLIFVRERRSPAFSTGDNLSPFRFLRPEVVL